MPNHCANQLRIRGPRKDLEAFREFAKGCGAAWDGKEPNPDQETKLDLNKFLPVPTEILTAKKKKGEHTYDAYNSGGYEWCVANWGTKWGCYDIGVNLEGRELLYNFQTAWSPFSPGVLSEMSRLYPRLNFELKYAEQGCCFCGIMTAYQGEVNDEYAESKEAEDMAAEDEEIQELMSCSG